MKNRIWSLPFVVAITFLACSKAKDCPSQTATAPADEVAKLKAFLDSSHITAIADPRGFFYTITTPGSSSKPTLCQNVTVAYVGKLTNQSIFDSSNGVSFPLSNLIAGWQEGIPLIGVGGNITLYIPPSLGYGNSAVQGIPAKSILIFTINLKAAG